MGKKRANQPGYTFDPVTRRWMKDSRFEDIAKKRAVNSVTGKSFDKKLSSDDRSVATLSEPENSSKIKNLLGVSNDNHWNSYSKSDTYKDLLLQMSDEHNPFDDNGSIIDSELNNSAVQYRDYFLEDYANWVDDLMEKRRQRSEMTRSGAHSWRSAGGHS